MTRAIGMTAFWAGMIALFAMLAVDVLGVRPVAPIWFASLAMILTGVMWLVPALRPQFGRRRHG